MSEIFDEPKNPSAALLPATSSEFLRLASRKRPLAFPTMVSAILTAANSGSESEVRSWAMHVADAEIVRAEVSVRVLLAAARLELPRDPMRAELMYGAAASIVVHLTETPAQFAASFRGHCLKGSANAFRCMGAFADALVALDRAECEFRTAEFCIGDIADVKYSRVLVLFVREDWAEAAAALAATRRTFKVSGNARGVLRCDYVAACIAYEEGSISAARDRWRKLLGQFESHADRGNIARTLLSLAACHYQLGDVDETRRLLALAKVLFTTLKMTTDLVRVDFWRAKVAVSDGDRNAALSQLREVMNRFDQLHMPADADVAGLELLAELIADESAIGESLVLAQTIADRVTRRGEVVSAAEAAQHLRDLVSRGAADAASVRHTMRVLRAVKCGRVRPDTSSEEPV